jgi:hypothetical protein
MSFGHGIPLRPARGHAQDIFKPNPDGWCHMSNIGLVITRQWDSVICPDYLNTGRSPSHCYAILLHGPGIIRGNPSMAFFTQHLDARSRLAVGGAFRRSLVLLACVVSPWPLGLCSLADVGASLPLAFNFASLVVMAAAASRREQAGRGSLNGWDEALAFNGIALFIRVVQGATA